MRSLTNAKHYKEKLRKEFAKEKTEVADTLPIVYLLKDNTYTVTPLKSCHYGYETKMVMVKWKLNGKTQTEQGVRNKQRRAVYRNFNWENLYDRCPLYWDFTEGKIENTQDIYFLARGMCGAEKGKNKFLEIMYHDRLRFCEKISVNSTTVIKNDIANGLKNSHSIFLQYTINTVICQVSSTVSLLKWSVAEWKCSVLRRCMINGLQIVGKRFLVFCTNIFQCVSYLMNDTTL